MKPRRTD